MWMLYAGLGFLGGQVLAAITVAIAGVLAGQYHQLAVLAKLAEPPTWYVVSTLFGLWGGFLGAAVLASRLKGTRHFLADLGVRFRWIDLIGIPIGFASQYVVALLYLPFETPHPQLPPAVQRAGPAPHGERPWRRLDRHRGGHGGRRPVLRGALLPGRHPAGARTAVRPLGRLGRPGSWRS